MTPALRREEPMKWRTLLTGTTALVGLSALPWRVTMAGHKGESGTPKRGGTLRVAFASDIHAGRFQLNRMAPPGYESFWVSNNTHNALVTLDPEFKIVPDLAKSWEGIDKHTFKVIMKEPAALLPMLAGYFQGVQIGSPTAVQKFGDGWGRHPVGTGPFTYDPADYRPDELVVLHKNPNYFSTDASGKPLSYLGDRQNKRHFCAGPSRAPRPPGCTPPAAAPRPQRWRWP